jgi:arylsulfatase A-like enzyme
VDRPNILLLTIDTLRTDMLGCYGNNKANTPNLDRLAAEGIRFEQAITGGSWTQAAFPVLLTSTYGSMYGGCLGGLSPKRPSPIEALAAHGYTTSGFSTNPHLSRATGYDRGFHHFRDIVPNGKDPWLRGIKGGQWLLRLPSTHYILRSFGRQIRPARVYSSAAEVTDHVCRWMGSVASPFFVWAHFMDTHWPYHIEETLIHAKEIAEAWVDLAHLHRWRSEKWDKAYASRSSRYLQLYEQSLNYLDTQIGRLLSHIDNLDLSSNTVIFLVSDHGEEFFEHGRWGHWEVSLYDEIIRVPLIMKLPGQSNGQIIERQVRTLDIMPTILDLCGCPTPNGILGTSLIPLWESNDTEYDVVPVISEMQRPSWHRIAVRTEDFKYIWDNKHPQQPELYDLRADPGETQNVSGEHLQEVGNFQACVNRHLQSVAETQTEIAEQWIEHGEEVIRRLRGLGYID